jgi:hypothetical protein
MRLRLSKKQAPPADAAPAPGPRMLALRASAKPNLVWRFFMDGNHRWRWQHLSVQHEVIAESSTSYKNYEECVADAADNGFC